jgi:hypothetical protein
METRLRQVLLDSELGYTTQDFRDAIGGKGPLAYTWSDKPHRLLFDLLKFIEANAENVKPLSGEIIHLTGAEMSAIMDTIKQGHNSVA